VRSSQLAGIAGSLSSRSARHEQGGPNCLRQFSLIGTHVQAPLELLMSGLLGSTLGVAVGVEGADAPAGSSGSPSQAPAPSAGAGGDRDCSDFSWHREAQAFFEAEGGPGRDPHRLDRDGDGLASEEVAVASA
jgi:hypothetical protein